MNFKYTVLIVALIILVLMLISIGVMLKYNRSEQVWPPNTSKCPDYWDVSGNLCLNRYKLGKYSNDNVELDGETGYKCSEMDSEDNVFTGLSAKCNKYKYAKECGVTWDGITTSNDVCN